jgi:hypothetical protein
MRKKVTDRPQPTKNAKKEKDRPQPTNTRQSELAKGRLPTEETRSDIPKKTKNPETTSTPYVLPLSGPARRSPERLVIL